VNSGTLVANSTSYWIDAGLGDNSIINNNLGPVRITDVGGTFSFDNIFQEDQFIQQISDSSVPKSTVIEQDHTIIEFNSTNSGNVLLLRLTNTALGLKFNGVDLFGINDSGQIRTNQIEPYVGNTFTNQLPIYNTSGLLIGKIPIEAP